MYKNKKILALIPARGGSKGLPGKNIKPMLGKPLIGWTIEQALASEFIDKVVVTTDDKEIAEISRKFKADVPFLRPRELAQDSSPTMDAVLHAVNWFEENGELYDILVLLEPSSPLRDSEDIDNSIKLLSSTPEAESIVGICQVESAHPSFIVQLGKENFLIPYLNKEFKVIRRQDIEDLYFFEGSLYVSLINSLKSRKNFYHEKCLEYIVPKWKSYEIDDLSDFIIIEALMKAKLKGIIK